MFKQISIDWEQKVYRIELFCFERTLDNVVCYVFVCIRIYIENFNFRAFHQTRICALEMRAHIGRQLGWNDDEFPYLLTPQICSTFLYSGKKLESEGARDGKRQYYGIYVGSVETAVNWIWKWTQRKSIKNAFVNVCFIAQLCQQPRLYRYMVCFWGRHSQFERISKLFWFRQKNEENFSHSKNSKANCEHIKSLIFCLQVLNCLQYGLNEYWKTFFLVLILLSFTL